MQASSANFRPDNSHYCAKIDIHWQRCGAARTDSTYQRHFAKLKTENLKLPSQQLRTEGNAVSIKKNIGTVYKALHIPDMNLNRPLEAISCCSDKRSQLSHRKFSNLKAAMPRYSERHWEHKFLISAILRNFVSVRRRRRNGSIGTATASDREAWQLNVSCSVPVAHVSWDTPRLASALLEDWIQSVLFTPLATRNRTLSDSQGGLALLSVGGCDANSIATSQQVTRINRSLLVNWYFFEFSRQCWDSRQRRVEHAW